jgi:hypothetical protein
MALFDQPAAARMATSCSASDKAAQFDVPLAAGDDGVIDSAPSDIRSSSERSGDNRDPSFLMSA